MANSLPYSDVELMQKVASQDSKALEALYDRYSPLLYTLIRKIIKDKELADEVLSDIFVIIWRKTKMFDFNSGSVYTWIITIARNKAIDAHRRQMNETEFPPYTDEYEDNYIIPKLSKSIGSLDLESALGMKNSLEKALHNLTDAQQYVLFLAYYEGLTQKEIAAKLNIPVPTVKSKIMVTLKSLDENLIKEGS